MSGTGDGVRKEVRTRRISRSHRDLGPTGCPMLSWILEISEIVKISEMFEISKIVEISEIVVIFEIVELYEIFFRYIRFLRLFDISGRLSVSWQSQTILRQSCGNLLSILFS